MPTLREVRAVEAQRRAEQETQEESREERHARYLARARKHGIRNLTADEYQQTATLVAQRGLGLGVTIGWPLDAPAMFNGSGEPCDMWTGPCACGASHEEGI